MFPVPTSIGAARVQELLWVHGKAYNALRPFLNNDDSVAMAAMNSHRKWLELAGLRDPSPVVMVLGAGAEYEESVVEPSVPLPDLKWWARQLGFSTHQQFANTWELTMAMSWATAVARRAHLRQDEAEDVAASVAERLHRSGGRPPPPALYSWVQTTAMNEIRDRVRRRDRRRESLTIDGEPLGLIIERQTTVDDFQDLRRWIELRDLLERTVGLTDVDRVVLIAIANGSHQAEIARDLGISKMTVSRQLARIGARIPSLALQLGTVATTPRAKAS